MKRSIYDNVKKYNGKEKHTCAKSNIRKKRTILRLGLPQNALFCG